MLQIVKSKTTLLRNVQNSNMTFIICSQANVKVDCYICDMNIINLNLNCMKRRLFSCFLVMALLGGGSAMAANIVPVTPAPLSYEQAKGTFSWKNGANVCFSGTKDETDVVKTAFSYSAYPVNYVSQPADGEKNIRLELDKTAAMPDEGYRLEVTSDEVKLKAKTSAGLFYGIQTLVQLAEAGHGKVRACSIDDAPRFPYRGIMLDVSRHFRSLDFVKKQIDLLSSLKINRLHLHLTDEAGWRLEIKKYPRLTGFAAWRPYANWRDWSDNGSQYCEQFDSRAQGGFYTQDEMRDLIDYARKRSVIIVPEIEMPSHSGEVLTAYPELSCTHELYKQRDFCVGNEKTFEFIENVLDEVIALFPSEYIHIGGDEASKTSWPTCPLCQKRMKDEGLKGVDELQSYLIKRVERYLNSKGRHLLGWDEILQGGVAPNATVMSWRGEQGGIDAVRSGHRAVMTPGAYCYFDSYQDAPNSQPLAIGGYLPLEKVYSYNPVPDSLSAEESKLIYGVQANLWTEYVPTAEHAEYMLYPRSLALAEVAWSQPEKKSWESFRKRVLAALPELRKKGYHTFNYSKEQGNRKEALKPIKHLALGKKVTYKRPYWRNYPANGEQTLTDGIRGGWNYSDQRWQGFVGNPRIDAVIDLDEVKTIHSVGADFMQICGPDVYMPTKVIISASEDGEHYSVLAEVNHKVTKDDKVSFKNFGWKGKTRARYIRYQADADSKIGGVLFIDEIVVK